MVTRLTALEIAGNYPQDILINAAKQDNGKWACFMYMLRDGDIHKIMLNSQGVFDSRKEATDYLHDLSKKCIEYVSNPV